jgi:hypothetical protein
MLPAVKIDRDRPVLLRDQVAVETRRAIAEGKAAPGERHHPLAASLPCSRSTPTRGAAGARLLRDERFWSPRRGRGRPRRPAFRKHENQKPRTATGSRTDRAKSIRHASTRPSAPFATFAIAQRR